MIENIRLENFRCFREPQTVRLAPLTLLVGQNGTGKTSFMAAVKTLWELATFLNPPDFNEPPYSLGRCEEIIHSSERKQPDEFRAGLDITTGTSGLSASHDYVFASDNLHLSFGVSERKIVLGELRAHEYFGANSRLDVGIGKRLWEVNKYREDIDGVPDDKPLLSPNANSEAFHIRACMFRLPNSAHRRTFTQLKEGAAITDGDIKRIQKLYAILYPFVQYPKPESRPFVMGPTRALPLPLYEHHKSNIRLDSIGRTTPMLFAEMSFYQKEEWAVLKQRLEEFGSQAGLFDEISVKRWAFTGKASDPFEIQIRKPGGPLVNLAQSGHGVGQVLPVAEKLLGDHRYPVMLLDQPETGTHPRAQAAIGSLLCRVASPDRQLIVATGSESIQDRVRMDIRDSVGPVVADDVSVLYFEDCEGHVRIHSIRFDEDGRVLGAPRSYRRFEMEEITRSVWRIHPDRD